MDLAAATTMKALSSRLKKCAHAEITPAQRTVGQRNPFKSQLGAAAKIPVRR
jgi:hypothetical protein